MKFSAVLLLAIALPALRVPASAAPPDGLDWAMTPAQVTSTCNAEIARYRGRVRTIVSAHGKRTFGNTILAFENAGADLNDRTAAQTFLYSVSPDKATRDASLACGTNESNAATEIQADPKLYAAVVSAIQSGTARTVYDKKISQITEVELRRSGASLGPAQRKEYIALTDQLTDLQNQFGQNLAEDATTIVVTLAQLQGVPADLIASYKKQPDGSYVVPVNESTISFMQYSGDENALKAFSIAMSNRQSVKNTALLEKALGVRAKIAHLLGFRTWADYVLADRMAASPAKVESFLTGLDQRVLPSAKNDIAELLALKRATLHDPNAPWNSWDFIHYNYLLTKTKYAVDDDAVRQYFPVQHTIDSVLAIYHRMLGVSFAPVVPAQAWAPDVLEYSVSDSATGKLLGYTYFDLYPRPGKYTHFANFPVMPYRRADGGARVPVAAIVGNWPKPGPGQPALLGHGDVETFFHEFGHDMAALLATAPYETLTNGFRWDFVEAPSQMLENFVWQPSILKEISSNVTTGAPLPDDLISKMIAARYVDYAYATTRQIVYAMTDMRYHTSTPPIDTTAVWAEAAGEFSPVPLFAGTHPQAQFGHIVGGGYDAGYYGYLWSKVYAQDMFTAFLSGGLENPTVGMRYRRDILEPARTYEPDAEVEKFLGRPMSPDAFYQTFSH